MPSNQTLYLKGERNIEVTKQDVTLGDIVSFECSDKTLIPKIKALRILKIRKSGKQRFV